jgi:uncharacterized protein with PQ loop repeat
MSFNFIEAIGWFGNLILSIGVIPQVYKTWKTHDVSSFNWTFLLMWALGVFFTFIYIAYDDITKQSFHLPLWLNYLVNILATFYLVFAKFKYGKKMQ